MPWSRREESCGWRRRTCPPSPMRPPGAPAFCGSRPMPCSSASSGPFSAVRGSLHDPPKGARGGRRSLTACSGAPCAPPVARQNIAEIWHDARVKPTHDDRCRLGIVDKGAPMGDGGAMQLASCLILNIFLVLQYGSDSATQERGFVGSHGASPGGVMPKTCKNAPNKSTKRAKMQIGER